MTRYLPLKGIITSISESRTGGSGAAACSRGFCRHSLVLNLSPATNIRTQNGQIFTGRLANQLLLVLYTATTRSLPPQTTPDEVVVFCPVS